MPSPDGTLKGPPGRKFDWNVALNASPITESICDLGRRIDHVFHPDRD
jgi:hypothetical protein